MVQSAEPGEDGQHADAFADEISTGVTARSLLDMFCSYSSYYYLMFSSLAQWYGVPLLKIEALQKPTSATGDQNQPTGKFC